MGAWLLAACGVVVAGVGVFFIGFRPPLLPEDRRYMAAPPDLTRAVPGLERWLEKVFRVMGGFILAVGVLTVDLALSGVRDGSTAAWVIAAVAGAASVGVMAVVNLMLRSDFRWPLVALAALWLAAVSLAALGV